jgi:choline dehydrogenase-like flavoprotein
MIPGVQFTEQFEVVIVGAGHAGCEVEVLARRLSRAPKSRAERGTSPSKL